MSPIQTFLPYADFEQSAAVLDYKRLGAQINECCTLLGALHETNEKGGYANHPAAKMWRGHELQLAQFGLVCEEEWEKRGYKVRKNRTTLEQHLDWARDGEMAHPWWFGLPAVHLQYQRLLLLKNYDLYSQYFPGVKPLADASEFVYPEN